MAAVQDHGGQNVRRGFQMRRQIYGFESPVAKIALRRTGGDEMAIHE